MISIRCLLGAASPNLDIPNDPLRLNGVHAEEYFAEASDRDIRLTIDDSGLGGAASSSMREVESLDLHRALAKLTNNPPTATKVQRIGLVFAGRYKPKPSVFGFMFDWGRKHAFEQHDASPFHGVAREGCAIFLDSIREKRPEEDDYRSQLAFTAIHELGHVFNLQHRSSPLSFMATSRGSRPYTREEGAFQFAEGERSLLRQCSQSPHVCPGGSDFMDLGPLAAADFPHGDATEDEGLELVIDVSPREFWPFEPVELDVTLRTRAGVQRTYRVPDAVDPGYEHFAIWIEDPTGELRRFRSPRHYCWDGHRMVVSCQKPFTRDVSLFVEAGGYTFHQAGRHTIYATFQAGRRRRLISNKVEVNIRPALSDDRRYVSLRNELTRSSHARLLYYRRVSRTRREAGTLAKVTVAHAGTAAADAVSYALGRAEAKAAELAGNAKLAGTLAASAVEHLDSAIEAKSLSEHRRRCAERLVTTLRTRASS